MPHSPDDIHSTGNLPPVADRRPLEIVQHGRSRNDPYAWLKADNWQEAIRDPAVLAADVRAHLEAENAWTAAQLEAPTAALQERLYEEMKGRIREDESSVPFVDGPFAYYRRFREGGEYAIHARRPAAQAHEGDAPETILLDGDAEGAGREYFDVRRARHSPDHRYFAWMFDDKGSEFYTLRIRDLETGEVMDEHIPDTYGEFVWGADSRSIYWIARNANARPEAVFLRTLGTGEDRLVYREDDPGFFISLSASLSRRFVFISAHNHTTAEWRYLDAANPHAEPVLIAAREDGVDYSVTDFDGRFLIRTNAGGAIDYRLCTAPFDAPGRESWSDLVPHRDGVLILDVIAFDDFLVRMERENGLPRIVVRTRASGEEHALAFDEAAYALGVSEGYASGTAVLRFDYASPTTPAQVFDYDMAARTRTLRKTQEVPSGHDPAAYVCERLYATAPDGETVPVTLLRRRDTPVDGSAPLLLYGYGAYGITIPADFRTARLSLVDRGMIYAIAHVRGGMAKGYRWYLDGKLAKKPNTFSDFVACGQMLCARGYTSPGRIVAMGGSAGGTLVGAAINQAPELFAGAIAVVPFVDVLNTISDASLPLTPPEWPEWGNPVLSAEDFDAIQSWSPYDQIADRPYPPVLATGGLTDPRVTYWEPAKWVARLRHDAPSGGPYFLRMNMDAGHGGASGRFSSLRETALHFAFALACTGLADGGLVLRRPG